MQGNPDSTRQRVIKFNCPISDDDCEEIKNSLSKLDGMDECKLENNQVFIQYQFPLLTFLAIMDALGFVRNKHSVLKRLLYSVLAIMEQNERDYLINSYGWHCYVEDVYIHYFDLNRKRKYNRQK